MKNLSLEMGKVQRDEFNDLRMRLSDNLQRVLDSRPVLVEKLLLEGRLSTTFLSLQRATDHAFRLAMLEAVVFEEIDAARASLSIPLEHLSGPGFFTVVSYLKEGMLERRLWDGQKIEIESHLKRILCYVLLGRIKDLVCEYEPCLDSSLFGEASYSSVTGVFIRHVIGMVSGETDSISLEQYEKSADFGKKSYLYGYHSLMCAISTADQQAFDAELEQRFKSFKKKYGSDHEVFLDEYGAPARLCFDAIGTAICRLARGRGLEVRLPDFKFYPEHFWLD